MKREIESLKSALRTGHLSTSEVRLPWTPEEKHRHQVNGDAEYENRCKNLREIRWNLREYSESCALSWSVDVTMTTNNHVCSKHGFLGLTGGSSEAIALHPDGVQRHHGEWACESPWMIPCRIR